MIKSPKNIHRKAQTNYGILNLFEIGLKCQCGKVIRRFFNKVNSNKTTTSNLTSTLLHQEYKKENLQTIHHNNVTWGLIKVLLI